MGYISLALLIITLLSIGFGALLGLIRGRNRALLRLAIIILCLILALVFKGVIANAVFSINVDGVPLSDYIIEQVASGGMTLPDSAVNLVFALLSIIVSLVAFIVAFIFLSGFSMIFFWIFKCFVPKGEKILPEQTEEVNTEEKPNKIKCKYKKHAGFGAIIGAVQGVLVAFIICVPLTGLCVQVDKISKIEINGEKILEIPEEIGVGKFVDSGICKIYSATGGWFFDSLTTTKDASGNKVSLDDTVEVVTTVTGVADSFTGVTENLGAMTSESATTEERVDAMKAVGQSFKEIGESMDTLGDDAKDLLNNVISSVVEMLGNSSEGGSGEGGGEGNGEGSGSGSGEGGSSEGSLPQEIVDVLKDIDINDLDFTAIGGAMEGMAEYIESEEDETGESELTQADVDAIVNGFAKNTFVLDLLKSGGEGAPEIMPVSEEHQAMFKTAIEKTNLSQEYKDLLYQLFGLTK